MQRKDLNISCPCCESRLTVDLRSEKVVSWRRAEQLDSTGKPVVTETDWQAANQRVSDREGGAADKLDQALNRERDRERDLDALFDQLKERGSEEEE